MPIHFYKYQGTGNDFIIIDNRNWSVTELPVERVKLLCDRRFGIGADGLMLLNSRTGYDFEMKYYNSDGKAGSMCGNGGRCMIRFAHDMGIQKNSYHFLASDGEHSGTVEGPIVKLKMKDVDAVSEYDQDLLLNTGSPHYIKNVSEVMDLDVFHEGMDIRYNADFAREGINVNFVEELTPGEIIVRTYERGVEDETYSCGTGVTASALVSAPQAMGPMEIKVNTKGGKLTVKFNKIDEQHFEDIWLCGPAERVFEGEIELVP